MADVKKFNIDGTEIDIKDEIARTAAAAAVATADAAYAKAEEVEQLSRLEIAYDSTTETISFTRSGGE